MVPLPFSPLGVKADDIATLTDPDLFDPEVVPDVLEAAQMAQNLLDDFRSFPSRHGRNIAVAARTKKRQVLLRNHPRVGHKDAAAKPPARCQGQ